MLSSFKRFWAEIDIDSIIHNFNIVKNNLSDKTQICCVVKADAYGHGAVMLSKIYEQLGADYFAVSNINEAIQLRKNGIIKPILILGYTFPEYANLLSEFDIEQCVFSYEYAKELNKSAKKTDSKIKIHLKLDSGMGRLGFSCKHLNDDNSVLEDAYKSCMLDSFIPYGIFTHFAVADEKEEGKEYTRLQYESFNYGIEYLKKKGIEFKIKHCSNSAGVFEYPDFHLDMVRAGIILYGLSPSEKTFNPNLKPVMSLKAIISQVKNLRSGDYVSYGCTFKAEENVVLATVPLGYADGFWRLNSNDGVMLVNGKRAKIVGRICMDQTMLDISSVPNVKSGDTAVIIGKSGSEYISADEIAKRCDTINYEIVCAVGKRVPRIYIKNNKIVGIDDYFSGLINHFSD